jgi:GNAT superfamily N-acetyltransferase
VAVVLDPRLVDLGRAGLDESPAEAERPPQPGGARRHVVDGDPRAPTVLLLPLARQADEVGVRDVHLGDAAVRLDPRGIRGRLELGLVAVRGAPSLLPARVGLGGHREDHQVPEVLRHLTLPVCTLGSPCRRGLATGQDSKNFAKSQVKTLMRSIEHRLTPNPFSKEFKEFERFELKNEAGQVLCFAELSYQEHLISHYELRYLETLPDYRNQGIGTQVLQAVNAWLKDNGAIGILENAIDDDAPVLLKDIYLKSGWIPVPGRPNELVFNISDRDLQEYFAKN